MSAGGRHDAFHSALDPVVSAPLEQQSVEEHGRVLATPHLFLDVGDDVQWPVPEQDARQVSVEALLGPLAAGFFTLAHRSAQSQPAVLRQSLAGSVVLGDADDDAICGQSDGSIDSVPDEGDVMPLTVVDGQVDAERKENVL